MPDHREPPRGAPSFLARALGAMPQTDIEGRNAATVIDNLMRQDPEFRDRVNAALYPEVGEPDPASLLRYNSGGSYGGNGIAKRVDTRLAMNAWGRLLGNSMRRGQVDDRDLVAAEIAGDFADVLHEQPRMVTQDYGFGRGRQYVSPTRLQHDLDTRRTAREWNQYALRPIAMLALGRRLGGRVTADLPRDWASPIGVVTGRVGRRADIQRSRAEYTKEHVAAPQIRAKEQEAVRRNRALIEALKRNDR